MAVGQEPGLDEPRPLAAPAAATFAPPGGDHDRPYVHGDYPATLPCGSKRELPSAGAQVNHPRSQTQRLEQLDLAEGVGVVFGIVAGDVGGIDVRAPGIG